jgi:hypothetical protein
MPEPDLSVEEINTINFARLWVDDEDNRYNEYMLALQLDSMSDEYVPLMTDTDLVLNTVKPATEGGRAGWFFCRWMTNPPTQTPCRGKFMTQHELDQHVLDTHAVVDVPAQVPDAPAPSDHAQAIPSPVSMPGKSGPANVTVPPVSPNTPGAVECFYCKLHFTSPRKCVAHRDAGECKQAPGFVENPNHRTFKGGYRTAFYTCFSCETYTSTLDRVKQHGNPNVAGTCRKRSPEPLAGITWRGTNEPQQILNTGRADGETYLYLDQNGGVTPYVLTELGWETMAAVAQKIDPNWQQGAKTPAPAPVAPVPAAPIQAPKTNRQSDVDLSHLQSGRYASYAPDGRTWFFLVTKRTKPGGWPDFLKTGDLEVKRYESDNLRLIGFQRAGEPNYTPVRSYESHVDHLRLVAARPEASAKIYAAESERCYVCGKKLTDPDSKRRGIGPDCFAQGKGYHR